MATKTITALDELSSGAVDRATDMLEIADVSATQSKKITPNALMGISGAAVGDTDSQTLTNKTLTSPTISNPTLSGTLSGTYTIGGTPTFPSSVVTLTGSQTLANKVLTSPTINTATIVNPTLTTDTVSEYTSANGVTVDGLNIKDGVLNTNNSVVTSNLTDALITGVKIASYKIIRQDNTTNSTESTARILSGWGVITPGVATSGSEAVTFNAAFTNLPIVIMVSGGDNAASTTYGAGGINIKDSAVTTAHTITTTGFTAKVSSRDASNYAAGNTVFYQWIAVGV